MRTLAPLLLAVALAAQDSPRRLEVMFFGAPTANHPGHDPITRYRVLKQALGTAGINLTYVEQPSRALAPAFLAGFDAVLMYGNWAQNRPMPRKQLDALVDYVERGGGFLPIHCASACFGGSPRFIRLVGARFRSHGGEVFSPKTIKPEHPIVQGLGKLEAWDETYVHSQHGDDREILQTREGEPWSWTRTQGKGRVFYTASGHDHRVWDQPDFHALLHNAILWCVGDSKRALLQALKLPSLETEDVRLPGYRQRKLIDKAQKPLPPAESMKLAQVPPGFRLELFAAEPDIVNPIYVSWDHRGRAFVIETIDYPNNLQQGNVGNDRITICEDTDKDGKADKFTRFADKLSIPTSLVFARDGVICTNGSQMLFLKDTDGDDKADVREVLFEGFNMGDTHAGPSNLRLGLDGWIWATIGYSGFDGEVGGKRVRFSQGVFRFKPDGSAVEFVQRTTNNTWGLGMTREGDWVGSTANANPSFYLTHPASAYAAVGLRQGRTPRADSNPRFFPMSWDIRQVDQFDRYTSAAGHELMEKSAGPLLRFLGHDDTDKNLAMVCGPTGKLVGLFDLRRKGAGFEARQLPNNLFASADAWTAPVCAKEGPDGMLWICDWYNIVVQHNPTPSERSAGLRARTGKGNAYVTPHRDKQHGRIYRITHEKIRLDEVESPPRVKSLLALSTGNLDQRLLHQERLSRGLTAAHVQGLKAIALKSAHALYLLHQTGKLENEVLRAALLAEAPPVRRAAIRLASPKMIRAALVSKDGIRAQGRDLAEVLVALADLAPDAKLGEALVKLAQEQEDELFEETALRDAWTIAARRHAAAVLAAAKAQGIESAAKTTTENLLPNADFEKTEGKDAAGWTDLRHYGGARGSVQVRSADGGRNGGRCLQVQSERSSDSGVAMQVRLEPGAHYRLSGWVKTEDIVTRRTPGVMLNVHGGARTRGLTGTQDWTRLSVEFEATRRRHTIHCLFGGYGGARGTAWFDDLSLVKISGGPGLEGALQGIQRYQQEKAAPAAVAMGPKFKVDPAVHRRGKMVYARTCIACHGAGGQGVPGAFPPLYRSEYVTGDPEKVVRIVLHGLVGPIEVAGKKFNSVMAPLGPTLKDQEIADVLTYVRQSYENDASPVSAETVKKVRAATKGRTAMWTIKELEQLK